MLFSNESKYRIAIDFHAKDGSPSKVMSLRSSFIALLCLLPFTTIWLWEPWFFQGQLWVQGALSLLLIVFYWQTLRTSKTAGKIVISVTEFGQCRVLATDAAVPIYASSGLRSVSAQSRDLLAFSWQITARSRLLPYAIWLNLRSGRRVIGMWVFRDELPQRDFRRLCVIVRYCQKHVPQKQDDPSKV